MIVGLAIFSYLVYNFGIERIMQNLQETGWWFAAIVATWGFVYLFNAFSWSRIVKAKENKIPFSQVFGLTVSGFSLNYITPFVGLGGEPYRIMAYKEYIGTEKSVSSVIIFTLMHMISHVVFWVFSMAWVILFLEMPMHYWLIMAVIFVVLLILLSVYIKAMKSGFFNTLKWLASKLPIKKLNEVIETHHDKLDEADRFIRDFYNTRKKDFYLVVFYEFVSRVISSLEYYFILMAVGVNIGIFEAIFINAGMSLVINLTFFIPFQLGAREGSLVFVHGMLGIDSSLGIYAGLVNRVREFFWILMGLTFIQLTGRKTKYKGERMNELVEADNAN
jgi:uncharacterized protein (TIRG00374 family)